MKRFIGVLFFVHVALASLECDLTKGKIIEKVSELSPYFELSFDIKPFVKKPGYRSIIHATIGNNIGRYGDRIASVWFHSHTTKLLICSAIDGHGNYCWSSAFELSLNQFTTVRISQTEIKGKVFYRIFINGVETFSKVNTKIQYFQDVKVYAADKWYEAANAVIKNYKLTNIVGPTLLTKGKVIDNFPQLSPYFELSFDIKPFAKNPGYRSIIHATIGNNIGRYGDRIASVWFYSHTTKLLICSAIDGNGNYCWSSAFELPLNEFSTIRILQQLVKGKSFYNIFIDGKEVFSKENNKIQYFEDVKVYNSDIWYDAPNAVMRNYQFKNLDGQCSGVILECKKNCPTTKTPVCGSNGKTYENLCALNVDACETKSEIKENYNGECDPCKRNCPTTKTPVCGSNGKTYQNLCALSVDACETKSEIKKNYDGECDPCKRNCPTTKTPVCGSNGKTYENLCALSVDACKTKSKIKKDYDGECDCSTTKTPVCGSNGKTYENLCALEDDACETESEIKKSHDGECVNSKCVFPFVYKGVTYRECTKVDSHKLWCSLDAVYKGRFEICQPTRTTS